MAFLQFYNAHICHFRYKVREAKYGGEQCTGPETDYRPCSTQACPVTCQDIRRHCPDASYFTSSHLIKKRKECCVIVNKPEYANPDSVDSECTTQLSHKEFIHHELEGTCRHEEFTRRYPHFQDFAKDLVNRPVAAAVYGAPLAPAYKPTPYSGAQPQASYSPPPHHPTIPKPNLDEVLLYAEGYLRTHPDITEEQLEEAVKHNFPIKRTH